MISIQKAILSSYLYEEVEIPIKLEIVYFDRVLHPFIAKINQFIDSKTPMSILKLKFDDSLGGHVMEELYISILIQNPLPLSIANRYYTYLIKEYRNNLISEGMMRC